MAPNLAPSQHDLIHDMIVDEKLRTLRKEAVSLTKYLTMGSTVAGKQSARLL
jgi:hypothetical protein